MSTSIRQLVTSSLRLLNMVQSGTAPSDDDIMVGTAALNTLLDSWSADRLSVYTVSPLYFTLVAGQRDYTLGPNGDFDVSRPMRIEQAYLSNGASENGDGTFAFGKTVQDIKIAVVNSQQYAAVTIKNTQSEFPTMVYDNGEYPLRKLSFFPVPSRNHVVTLWMWRPLDTFGTIDDPISLPPGYERALKFNLAVEIAAEFGKELSKTTYDIALESYGQIKRLNAADRISDLR